MEYKFILEKKNVRNGNIRVAVVEVVVVHSFSFDIAYKIKFLIFGEIIYFKIETWNLKFKFLKFFNLRKLFFKFNLE